MDSLKDFFTPIYDRVKSPLYSTFIISFLLINWKIIYAIFTDDKVIEGLTKIKFLQNRLSCQYFPDLFLWPLLSCVIYLFILPHLDRFVFSTIEISRQKKLAEKHLIMEKYPVSGERFVNLLKSYKKLKDDLAKIEIESAKRLQDAIEKENGIIDIENERNDFKKVIDRIRPISLLEIFEGQWLCMYRNKNSSQPSNQELFVINQQSYNIISNSALQEDPYKISNIIYDSKNHYLSFLKYRQNNTDEHFTIFKIVELTWREGKEIYSGTEKTLNSDSSIHIIDVSYQRPFEKPQP